MKKFHLRITGDLGFEVWQDIPGYEEYYQASTYGRIRNKERTVWNGRGYYTIRQSIKTPSLNKNYLQVKFSVDNTDKMFLLHRLIAITFLPNFKKLPCINHKDEKPQNNRVENLEWCTVAYNNAYNGRYNRVSDKMGKRIQQIYNGTIIAEYPSVKRAASVLRKSAQHISECARGIIKQYGGYIWRYA